MLRRDRGLDALKVTLWVLALRRFHRLRRRRRPWRCLPALAAPAFAFAALCARRHRPGHADARLARLRLRLQRVCASCSRSSPAQVHAERNQLVAGVSLIIAAGVAAPALVIGAAASAARATPREPQRRVPRSHGDHLGVSPPLNFAVRLLYSAGAPLLQPISFAEAGAHVSVWLAAALIVRQRARYGARPVRDRRRQAASRRRARRDARGRCALDDALLDWPPIGACLSSRATPWASCFRRCSSLRTCRSGAPRRRSADAARAWRRRAVARGLRHARESRADGDCGLDRRGGRRALVRRGDRRQFHRPAWSRRRVKLRGRFPSRSATPSSALIRGSMPLQVRRLGVTFEGAPILEARVHGEVLAASPSPASRRRTCSRPLRPAPCAPDRSTAPRTPRPTPSRVSARTTAQTAPCGGGRLLRLI